MSKKIAQELNTVMPGGEPLSNLKAVQVDIDRFKVLSARNGSATMHEVNLGESPPTCTCKDEKFNQDPPNVCAHVAKAALVADSAFSPERAGLQASLNVLHEARHAAEKIENLENLLGRLDEANRAGTAEKKNGGNQPENPIEDLKSALEKADVPVGELVFEEKNDKILFGPDGYIDDSDGYGAFVEFSQSNDAVNYEPDSDGPDNSIWKSDVPKVM